MGRAHEFPPKPRPKPGRNKWMVRFHTTAGKIKEFPLPADPEKRQQRLDQLVGLCVHQRWPDGKEPPPEDSNEALPVEGQEGAGTPPKAEPTPPPEYQTVAVGEIVYTLPYQDLFRPLTSDEAAKLRAGLIEQQGNEVPVLVDEDNNVLDGAHRLLFCVELGLTPKVERRSGLSAEQKLNLAFMLNESRRQMTEEDLERAREERQRRVVELRQQGASLRTIAEEVGVSEKQVRNDLAAATADGYAVEPKGGQVKGRDGKKRSAKSRRKPKAPKREPSAECEPETQNDTEAEKPAPAKGTALDQADQLAGLLPDHGIHVSAIQDYGDGLVGLDFDMLSAAQDFLNSVGVNYGFQLEKSGLPLNADLRLRLHVFVPARDLPRLIKEFS